MCRFHFTDLELMSAKLQGNAVKKGALTLVLANGNKLGPQWIRKLSERSGHH